MREAESSRKTLLTTRNGTKLQTDKQNEGEVNLSLTVLNSDRS